MFGLFSATTHCAVCGSGDAPHTRTVRGWFRSRLIHLCRRCAGMARAVGNLERL